MTSLRGLLKLVTSLVVVYGLLVEVTSAPVQTQSQALEYLRRYGYLVESQSSNHRPPDDAAASAAEVLTMINPTAAIVRFQKFAGLPLTGILDQKTLAMMSLSRCGMADDQGVQTSSYDKDGRRRRRTKRYVLSGYSWQTNRLTYYFRNYTGRLPQSVVRGVVRKAFQMWTNASSLVVSEATDLRSANIRLLYANSTHGDNFPFDGPAGVLAHAFYPDGSVIGGDAHFDDAETWTVNSATGTNLLQVTAHELGHTFGLAHNNDPNSGSIMRPFYAGFEPNFQLGVDDVNGIIELYGTADDPKRSAATLPSTTTLSYRPTPARSNSQLCQNASIDAMVSIGADVIAFSGNTYAMLRWSSDGLQMVVRSGFPRPLSADWSGLGGDVTSIDAALYVDGTSSDAARLFLFHGDKYWKFSNWTSRQPDSGYPRLISRGFPGIPDNLDSAFVWGANKHIFFVKGGQYYGYTRKQGVDAGFPKPLSLWSGVPTDRPISAVYSATEQSKTFFFAGQDFYRFDDTTFKVEAGPLSTAVQLFGCSKTKAPSDQLADGLAPNTDVGIADNLQSKNDDSVPGADLIQENSRNSAVAAMFPRGDVLHLLVVWTCSITTIFMATAVERCSL